MKDQKKSNKLSEEEVEFEEDEEAELEAGSSKFIVWKFLCCNHCERTAWQVHGSPWTSGLVHSPWINQILVLCAPTRKAKQSGEHCVNSPTVFSQSLFAAAIKWNATLLRERKGKERSETNNSKQVRIEEYVKTERAMQGKDPKWKKN